MRFRATTPDQVKMIFSKVIETVVMDGPQMIEVKKFRPPKTRSQHNKMFAMIDDIAQHVGYHREELRSYLKEEYGPSVVVELPDREPRRIPKSMADYSKEEAHDMIERLYQIAAECGAELSE